MILTVSISRTCHMWARARCSKIHLSMWFANSGSFGILFFLTKSHLERERERETEINIADEPKSFRIRISYLNEVKMTHVTNEMDLVIMQRKKTNQVNAGCSKGALPLFEVWTILSCEPSVERHAMVHEFTARPPTLLCLQLCYVLLCLSLNSHRILQILSDSYEFLYT